MKLYELIIEDGKDVYKVKLVAKNKKALKELVTGTIIKCTDITDIAFCSDISYCCDCLVTSLYEEQYGENEVLILRALLQEFLEKR